MFCLLLVAVSLGFAETGCAAAVPPHGLSCLKNDEIRSLAQSSWHDNAYDTTFAIFAKKPAIAACYLINELHVVPEKWIRGSDQKSHPNTMHVVWALRALRYLTGGYNFKAETKYRFNESSEIESNRKQFLSPEQGEVPFFAVWMSRDSLAIAPADAQKAIIEKWIDWYQKNGSTFMYHPAVHVDDWYF
jgi:hypothetical protein